MKLALFILLLLIPVVPAFSQKAETMTVKVFFHPSKLDPETLDCSKGHPVTRVIPKTRGVAAAAMQELLKGPTPEEADEYSSFGPPETTGILKSVNVKNGTAYVNFTKRTLIQMRNATSSCGSGYFARTDATLLQFPTIKKVVYAIEGDTDEFYGWIQLGDCPHGKKHCSSRNFK